MGRDKRPAQKTKKKKDKKESTRSKARKDAKKKKGKKSGPKSRGGPGKMSLAAIRAKVAADKARLEDQEREKLQAREQGEREAEEFAKSKKRAAEEQSKASRPQHRPNRQAKPERTPSQSSKPKTEETPVSLAPKPKPVVTLTLSNQALNVEKILAVPPAFQHLGSQVAVQHLETKIASKPCDIESLTRLIRLYESDIPILGMGKEQKAEAVVYWSGRLEKAERAVAKGNFRIEVEAEPARPRAEIEVGAGLLGGAEPADADSSPPAGSPMDPEPPAMDPPAMELESPATADVGGKCEEPQQPVPVRRRGSFSDHEAEPAEPTENARGGDEWFDDSDADSNMDIDTKRERDEDVGMSDRAGKDTLGDEQLEPVAAPNESIEDDGMEEWERSVS